MSKRKRAPKRGARFLIDAEAYTLINEDGQAATLAVLELSPTIYKRGIPHTVTRWNLVAANTAELELTPK